MLDLKCLGCGNKLKKSGAILFSPVKKNAVCYKYQLCRKCFSDVIEFLGRPKNLSKD